MFKILKICIFEMIILLNYRRYEYDKISHYHLKKGLYQYPGRKILQSNG